MREEIVMPATARRLAQQGFAWEPQVGDWCVVLDAAYVGEGRAGLWLVVAVSPNSATLGLVDSTGQWPIAQVSTHDCLWLPSAGKLKVWLRAHGYSVTTGEAPTRVLGATMRATRDLCRLMRTGDPAPIDGEGMSEAEAVADALLRLLADQGADPR